MLASRLEPRSGSRAFSAAIALVALALTAPPAAASPQAEHVVLVSIDGFRPDFYLDPTWPAPTVQQMAREGVYAERVQSVFPSVTYPSHTTIVTGALPARHGIYYNRPFEPAGQSGRWYWEEEAIRVETLWDAVRRSGREAAAVSWPVTVGAPIARVLPEVWSLDSSADRLGPMRDTTRPPGLWSEIEREATGRITSRTFSISWMSRDDVTGAAAAYLLETYRPALLALHLISSDHFQHESGRNSDEARRAVGAADRAVGAVREAAERAAILDRTAFVITGDHGFVDVHTELAPNVWLVEAGLMEPTSDRGDWRATFHTTGGAALLHLRDPEDRQAIAEVRSLLAQVPGRVAKLFRVVERPELDRIGADPHAPLALAATLGVQFVARGDGELLAPGEGGQHGFFPSDFPEIYTGFVGWGAGLGSGRVAHVLGLEDIAPLIAALLGLDFEAADGTVPLGLLAPRTEGE